MLNNRVRKALVKLRELFCCCPMGVALLNTRAGNVVESGKSHKIFPGKILGYTVVVVVLNNRVVVEESGESPK